MQQYALLPGVGLSTGPSGAAISKGRTRPPASASNIAPQEAGDQLKTTASTMWL